MDLKRYKFLICGYGLPAELGLATLFAHSCVPDKLRVLTHEVDSRNEGLYGALKLRNVQFSAMRPGDEATIDFVKDFDPDVLICLHYRQKIPREILGAVKVGAFNLHPSLLPRYRGANSIPWALINGDGATGFSYHYMNEDFDDGRIIFQQRFAISECDTAFSLFHKQILQALPFLPHVISCVLEGKAGFEQQGEASYFSRELPLKGVIDPSWDLQKIDRFVRAMYFPPHRPARLVIGGADFYVRSLQEYVEIATANGISISDS